MSWRRAAGWLILLALVGLSAWLLETVRDAQQATRPVVPPDTPDYTATQLHVRQLDPTGRLHYILKSPYARHLPDGDRLEADTPRLWVHREAELVWEGESDRGTILQGGNLILLRDNVVLVSHARKETSPPTFVYTDRARIRPDRHLADTDAPVRIVSGAQWTHGVGMRLDYRTGHMVLLSNAETRVKSRHETPS